MLYSIPSNIGSRFKLMTLTALAGLQIMYGDRNYPSYLRSHLPNFFVILGEYLLDNTCQLSIVSKVNLNSSEAIVCRCSAEKRGLRNSAKFTGKNLCRSLF